MDPVFLDLIVEWEYKHYFNNHNCGKCYKKWTRQYCERNWASEESQRKLCDNDN